MQTIRYIMSGAAGLLLLNSCVKDELYKTPHPDKGRITITADWSHRSTDCPLPEEYVLLHSCCEGTALKVPADREFCHPSLFEPNSHTLIAWNNDRPYYGSYKYGRRRFIGVTTGISADRSTKHQCDKRRYTRSRNLHETKNARFVIRIDR